MHNMSSRITDVPHSQLERYGNTSAFELFLAPSLTWNKTATLTTLTSVQVAFGTVWMHVMNVAHVSVANKQI